MIEWVVAQCAEDVSLRLAATDRGLCEIHFDVRGSGDAPAGSSTSASLILEESARQLRAYFAGALREFSIPLDPRGTEFQMRVWRQLETIPFGEVRSYAQVAEAVGAPRAVRAVGAANGANPLPIVVPCHRVIGSSGKLVGYGGGLALKRRLLDLEGCNMVLFRT